MCVGCSRSHRQSGSHTNSELKGVIENGGGEERDALREHLSPLLLTLHSSYVGCGDLCLPVSTSSPFSVVLSFLSVVFACLLSALAADLCSSFLIFFFHFCLLAYFPASYQCSRYDFRL